MKNEWHDIYRCRQTILEMLADRGFPQNTLIKKMSLTEFQETFPSATSDRNSIKIHAHKGTQTTVVHFFDESKVGLKALKAVLETFERQGIYNIILVCKESLSSAGMKHIESTGCNFSIEVFKEKELFFNITKHELVPEHRMLGREEKVCVLKERKVKEHQMPRILASDPVARYFGAKRGDVFEILRKNEVTGIEVYYRVVV